MWSKFFEVAEALLSEGFNVYIITEGLSRHVIAEKNGITFSADYCSEHYISSNLCREPEKADFIVEVTNGFFPFVRISPDVLSEYLEKYLKVAVIVPLIPEVQQLVLRIIYYIEFKEVEDEVKRLEEEIKEIKRELKEEGLDEELKIELQKYLYHLKEAKKKLIESVKEALKRYIKDIYYERKPSELYDIDYWFKLSRESDTMPPIPFSEIYNVWELEFPTLEYSNEGYVLQTDKGWFFIWIRGYPEGFSMDIYRLDIEEMKVFLLQCEYKYEYSEEIGLTWTPEKCREIPLEESLPSWIRLKEGIKKQLEG